jgi:hypothetical protein
MEEAEARLFWPSGDQVCASHVHEAFLQSTATASASGQCVVCGSSDRTIELDALMDVVVAGLRANRSRAIDELYFDRESPSGYASASVVDTFDAVMNDLAGDVDDELAELIAQRLEPDDWFDPGDLWLLGSELLSSSWREFSDWIKDNPIDVSSVAAAPLPEHWYGEQADGIPPSRLLARLIELIDNAGLLIDRPIEPWHRVTYVGEGEVPSAKRLGSPPLEFATQPNRFSPVGVSAFYATVDPATAIAETPVDPTSRPVLSAWLPSRPLRVVDLTLLPPIPSYWDVERTTERHWLTFLKGFSADVSVPISPDDRIRDYRPTQAVSHAIREWGEADGIVFASSKSGEPNCVLFVDNDHCVDELPPEARTDLFLAVGRPS